jgi:hypothetical protein
MKSKPTGKTYEIRTLQDIYMLPTHDAMERCLKELGEMMASARAYAELLTATAQALAEKDGKKIPDSLWGWPETAKWTDDGGIVGSEIKLCDPADASKVLGSLQYTKA